MRFVLFFRLNLINRLNEIYDCLFNGFNLIKVLKRDLSTAFGEAFQHILILDVFHIEIISLL